MKRLWRKTRVFWEEHELRIVTMAGFLVIGALSFFLGSLHGQQWQQKPLVITRAEAPPQIVIETTSDSGGAIAGVTQDNSKVSTGNKPVLNSDQSCMYVGSKNSNKYYPPTCSFAKRVKPENLRCFTSDEDAIKKGYVRSKGC